MNNDQQESAEQKYTNIQKAVSKENKWQINIKRRNKQKIGLGASTKLRNYTN